MQAHASQAVDAAPTSCHHCPQLLDAPTQGPSDAHPGGSGHRAPACAVAAAAWLRWAGWWRCHTAPSRCCRCIRRVPLTEQPACSHDETHATQRRYLQSPARACHGRGITCRWLPGQQHQRQTPAWALRTCRPPAASTSPSGHSPPPPAATPTRRCQLAVPQTLHPNTRRCRWLSAHASAGVRRRRWASACARRCRHQRCRVCLHLCPESSAAAAPCCPPAAAAAKSPSCLHPARPRAWGSHPHQLRTSRTPMAAAAASPHRRRPRAGATVSCQVRRAAGVACVGPRMTCRGHRTI
jgi:hypothetical protein